MKTIRISGIVILLLLVGVLQGALFPACGGDDVASYFAEGKEKFDRDDYNGAIESFRKGLQLDPSNRDLLFYVGVSFRREAQYDSALIYLRRTALLHKRDREVNQELYEIAMTLGEWEVAHSAVGALMETGDAERDHYLTLARLFQRMDWPLNHFYYLRKYMELFPEDSSVYVEAAMVSMPLDSTDVGLAILDSAIVRFGDDTRYKAVRGLIFAYRGEYETAEGILRPLLAADTGAANIKYTLGRVLADQSGREQWQEALELLRGARHQLRGMLPIDSLIADLENRLN
jgi:tetratricopeptide (TPR) repeat protein